MTLPQRFKRHLKLTLRPFLDSFRALISGSWLHVLLRLTVLSAAIGFGAVAYTWTGLISISADAGHWPITTSFLGFAMRNTVETQAMGVSAPPLDDPAAVLKGAGYYATGCALCHGAPGEAQSVVVKGMTPKPPYLPDAVSKWEAAELFWIVKNGLKYTGMPAWPVPEREDEVWTMVAFLQQLPGMSVERYARLAYGERAGEEAPSKPLRHLTEALDPVLVDCARCHGREGAGRGLGAAPILAGQSESYLLASLRAFATGERKSGIMQPIAANLKSPVMEGLARYYSGQTVPPRATEPVEDPDAIGRGKRKTEKGVPEAGIPGCVHCHGPTSFPRNPMYPNLAGQYADYLALQLELFKAGKRGGTAYANVMHTAAKRLSKDQIRELALYYASQR